MSFLHKRLAAFDIDSAKNKEVTVWFTTNQMLLSIRIGESWSSRTIKIHARLLYCFCRYSLKDYWLRSGCVMGKKNFWCFTCASGVYVFKQSFTFPCEAINPYCATSIVDQFDGLFSSSAVKMPYSKTLWGSFHIVWRLSECCDTPPGDHWARHFSI